jgi:subtilisin family serine protease
MTKNLSKLCILLFLVSISCSKEETISPTNSVIPESQKTPLTADQVRTVIDQSFAQQESFDWNQATNHVLWSAIVASNNLATVGFGDSDADFDRSVSKNAAFNQNQILEIIKKSEGKSLDKILVKSDPYLNLVDVIIEKQETIYELRKLQTIRYLEPADFLYELARQNTQKASSTSSGCGYDSEILNTSDYTTTTPNAKVPWNFYRHNITSAWNVSTGSGITIGIVDTGVSPNQTLLGNNFNDGFSSGRSIQKYGTYVDSIWPWNSTTDGPNDQCGHGTSMSSVATAPRNDNGLPVGVAYNANLIVFRAAKNVVLEGFREHNGVKDAFTSLANNNSVKIISMSMGTVISVGKISDGVKYAFSKGKLIFCAGGTSTSFTNFVGVIFPAWMDETIAVTGVKEGTSNQKCDVCHSGSKIDFTIQMQRSSNGNTIPVLSYYDNQNDYVGGSSVATATTAGIAALVWAKNPSWNKDQVLNKMKQASTYYPNKNSDYGYGNINALLAVQ